MFTRSLDQLIDDTSRRVIESQATRASDVAEQMLKNYEKPRRVRKRKEWSSEGYKLLSVSAPQISRRRGCNKKYVVELRYLTQQGLKRRKTIYFGIRGKDDYVDDEDEPKRFKRFLSCRNSENLFHPNHWRLLLLNRCKTIGEAYARYLDDAHLI